MSRSPQTHILSTCNHIRKSNEQQTACGVLVNSKILIAENKREATCKYCLYTLPNIEDNSGENVVKVTFLPESP